MVFFKLSPEGVSMSWVKHSNDAPNEFIGGFVGVSGDFVFFGGVKIVSNQIREGSILKLNKANGQI